MTNLEYDILDELYFVISYADLKEQINLEEEELKAGIAGLFEKGWVRVFASPDDTLDYEKLNDDLLVNSYLLASKTGLKAHNTA